MNNVSRLMSIENPVWWRGIALGLGLGLIGGLLWGHFACADVSGVANFLGQPGHWVACRA